MKTRRGFSFTEVMFAVIILGVGFIMVAAIFPVAIQQTRMTVDESTAAAVARQATAALEQLAIGSETAASGQPLFPKSERNNPMHPPNLMSIRRDAAQPAPSPNPPLELWQRISGNMILASDPRYAWTMVYSRGDNQFVQAYVFVLHQRNRSTFDQRDLQFTGLINLEPRLVQVQVQGANVGTGAPASIRLNTGTEYGAEGAFVVIASGPYAGHVYRLGTLEGNDIYTPDPGYPVPETTPTTTFTADAWVVGRGMTDPPDFSRGISGPAMDVSIYTTFFSVN